MFKKIIIDYKIIAGGLFEEMINRICEKVSSSILKVEIVENVQTLDDLKEISTTKKMKMNFVIVVVAKKLINVVCEKKKKMKNVL